MSLRRAFRAVLFDWDGTLVDSAERTFGCYARVFGAYGIGFDQDAFERTYSPDWYRTYEQVGLAREHWSEADARWISCYETEPSRLLPGAREAIERLAVKGVAQGLVSSGDGARVRREIQALDLERFLPRRGVRRRDRAPQARPGAVARGPGPHRRASRGGGLRG